MSSTHARASLTLRALRAQPSSSKTTTDSPDTLGATPGPFSWASSLVGSVVCWVFFTLLLATTIVLVLPLLIVLDLAFDER